MRKLILLAALAVMIPCMRADSLTAKAWGNNPVQVLPMAIPTSATTIVSASVDVLEIVLTNSTGSAITVVATDRQGTPVQFIPTVTVAANSTYIIPYPMGYYCLNGIVISASSTGMSFYMEGRQ